MKYWEKSYNTINEEGDGDRHCCNGCVPLGKLCDLGYKIPSQIRIICGLQELQHIVNDDSDVDTIGHSEQQL